MSTKARQIGPYSRPCVLAKLDQRTREARLLRETRAALVAHVGGAPSATQLHLIERGAWLTLGVAQLDARLANGVAFTQHDHNSYLAWSNALRRTLAALGTQPAPTPADPQAVMRRVIDRHRATNGAAA